MVVSSERLSWRACLAYGAPGLPLALCAISFYVYLPKFYADVVAIDISVIGTIVLVSRIWDAVLDPLIGVASDRTRSRWGRRRPWIAAAILPLIVCFFLLGSPSANSGLLIPSSWFALWTFGFFFFWTMFVIPYESLGAELSFDYHERTRILGVRDGATVLGTLLAAVAPVVLERYYPAVTQEKRFLILGAVYCLLLLFTAAVLLSRVKERAWRPEQKPTGGMLENLSRVLGNKPFRILLLSYTIGAFGAALPATLILFYVEHVLGGSAVFANQFLVLYFLVGFLFLPGWVWLAGKIGKKEAWLAAMVVNTGAFAGVFLLGPGDFFWYGILVACSALGYGATLALPSSMQADVIDLDELDHGTRKEGQFIGLWSVAKKLSAALGAGIALKVLGCTGYRPDAMQNSETIFALRALYAGVPCICNALAILIAMQYPITQQLHQDIRRRIDARTASLPIAAPLALAGTGAA